MKLYFPNTKILLIGDFMIDHYLFGSSNRDSPEAPIPVINFNKEIFTPGGAGNVAMNLKSFGASVTCVGCVGNDSWGQKLINILTENQISTEFIEQRNEHYTTRKQRIYCENVQQSRLDFEEFLSDWVPTKKINFENYDMIVLSDYNKGIFYQDWFSPNEVGVILDPKIYNSNILKHADIITPNLKELGDITNSKITDISSIKNAANFLIDKFEIKHVVVTKGDKGISIFSQNGKIEHLEAHKVNNPDVTGAGDTVISALSCVYSKTKDIKMASKIANAAAAVAVNNKGTYKIDINEVEKLL